MADGDPGPGAVEPHTAFYGLWPKFADPAEAAGASTPGRATAVHGAAGWWATCHAPSLRSA